MASKHRIEFLDNKIEILKQQRQNLHEAVDEYIDRAVTEGKTWIESQRQTDSGFWEICRTIDSTTTFVFERIDEFRGESDKNEGHVQRSQSETKSAPTTTTPSATLPSSAAHSSSATHEERASLVQADDHLKLQQRVEKIESEMAKMSERVDEIEGLNIGTEPRRKKMKKSDEMKDLQDVGDIKSEVSSLSSRVRVVEKKQENQQIQQVLGFTAQVQGTPVLTQDTIVTNFTVVKINKGDHFSPFTGVFIAPVDGLYLTSLCLWQWGGGDRRLIIYHERVTSSQAGSGQKMEVCGAWTNVKDGCSSSLGLVNMRKGGKLYVEVDYVTGSKKISWPSNFSCVLIG